MSLQVKLVMVKMNATKCIFLVLLCIIHIDSSESIHPPGVLFVLLLDPAFSWLREYAGFIRQSQLGAVQPLYHAGVL